MVTQDTEKDAGFDDVIGNGRHIESAFHAWCVAENIVLIAVDERLGNSLRIPMNRERDITLEKFGMPKNGTSTGSGESPALATDLCVDRAEYRCGKIPTGVPSPFRA